MAKELQVKEFSALPVADDGKTLLYADGEVKQSSKNLSEMLTDEVNNKLDTTAFSTVSGNFLTAHQVIPSGKWENVSDIVIANSATWETETDWSDDISAASAYAYEQAIAQIPAPFDPTFLSGEIDKKLDKTFSSNFYPMTGNPSGFLTEHQDLSNYYTKSETSGATEISNALITKQDTLTFEGTNNTITSINNSAIGGGNVGGNVGNDYVPLSAIECTIGSGNSSVSGSLAQGENNLAGFIIVYPETTIEGELIPEHSDILGYSFAQGKENSAYPFSMAQGNHNVASYYSFAQGYGNVAESQSLAQGFTNTASQNSFAQGTYNKAYNNCVCFGSQNSALDNSFTQGENITAGLFSFAAGKYNFANHYSQAFGYGLKATKYTTAYGYEDAVITYGSFVIGEFNKTSAAPFVIGNGTSDNNRKDLFVIDKDGNVSAQGQIYAEGGVLGASLDTLELAPDNETIEFVTSSHNVVNGEGEPEEYTVIKIKTSLLNKINELYNLVSSNSGTSNWVFPQ